MNVCLCVSCSAQRDEEFSGLVDVQLHEVLDVQRPEVFLALLAHYSHECVAPVCELHCVAK
jgi:hypothetical protein